MFPKIEEQRLLFPLSDVSKKQSVLYGQNPKNKRGIIFEG